MNFSAKNAVLAISLFAGSSAAISGEEPAQYPGPEGVALDLSKFDLHASNSETSKAAAASQPLKASATNKAVTDSAGVAVTTSQSPATAETKENSDSVLLAAVVDAMRPQEQIPALENDRFSLYVSDEVVSAQFERSASRFNLEAARVHLAFLYSEERDSIFQSGLVFDSNFKSNFRLSFGGRAYIAILGPENVDAIATAIGAETAYRLPFRALPLEFGASLYYAPDVLTFGSADRVIDSQVDVTLPFRSQLSVFTGVRFLQVDTRPGDREVDNRLHIGLRWDFL